MQIQLLRQEQMRGGTTGRGRRGRGGENQSPLLVEFCPLTNFTMTFVIRTSPENFKFPCSDIRMASQNRIRKRIHHQ